MSRIIRVAGALAAATALCALGAGSALAATPAGAATPSPSGTTTGPHYPNAKTGDYVFFDATPWDVNVYKPNDAGDPAFTIKPGQSVLIPHAQMVHYGEEGSLIPSAEISFYPPNGNLSQAEVNTTGYPPGVHWATGDGLDGPNGMGVVVQTPNVTAGEAGPTQISVYNSKNFAQTAPLTLDADASGADPTAMGNFLSDMALLSNSNWISFKPGDGDPISWGHGPQSLAGAPVWNCGSGEAAEQIGGQAQHQETTNVTGTVSFQQQVKLLDTVNTSITESVSVGHAWTDSTTSSHTETKNVDPWSVAWINSIPATETVTGTVTMTDPAAPAPIHFENVTFSEPGRNASGNPALDYAYVAHSRAMTQDEINTYCGGPGPDGNKVVVGGTVPNIMAGSTSPAGSGR